MQKKYKKTAYFLGMEAAKVADLCGVSYRQVCRWIAAGRAPIGYQRLIEAHRDRRVIPEKFAGRFVIRHDGAIGTATGYTITPGQLETYGWHLAAFYRQERLHALALAVARKRADELENQLKTRQSAAIVPLSVVL